MFNSKRTRVRVAFASALAASYLLWSIARLRFDDTSRPSLQPDQPLPQMQLPCRSLPGTDEVLIILRSGSTELNDRLAIHLSTSVRCFPNYLIFSDLEENYGEEHILDALADVDPGIVKENPDFELYRRLQKGGRISLTPSELAGPPDTFASLSGKTDNPGWKLDKWKFLPMVNKTLHERPNMKWYVFVEADTFLLWSALQRYLDLLDPTEPIYAGSPTFVGGVMFAHGGSGFVVSQPALRMVVNHYATHKAEIEKFTDSHWAGDCVLGKAFTDSGIPLTNAWPAMQGDYPGIVQYAGAVGSDEDTSRLWCGISVSYHHMSAAMIEELWVFEQDWAAKNDPVRKVFMRPKLPRADYYITEYRYLTTQRHLHLICHASNDGPARRLG
jgi:hypothetical protein